MIIYCLCEKVRAQNLGDLVYKGGVGGVNRAAASIIFDNRDKSPGKCPPRYEKYDEIIVSRTVESTGTCKVGRIYYCICIVV